VIPSAVMGTMLPLWWALQAAAPGVGAMPATTTTTTAPVVAHGAPPVVVQGPAPAPAPVYGAAPIDAPPRGTWMRVGGGLAIGVGSLFAVAALTCYATTDALDRDDLAGRESLRLISFGLGLAALAHVGAGVPLLVIGKQRKRRYEAWSREHVAWRPRIAASARGWSVGLTLRF